MDIYKLASKQQLRFATNVGLLSVEQLWTLTQTQLTALIKSLKKVLKDSDGDDELSFLITITPKDTENQLRFDIAKDIYLTKKAENDELRAKAERKEHNQKILALIQEKKGEELKGKSIEDLEKMLQQES